MTLSRKAEKRAKDRSLNIFNLSSGRFPKCFLTDFFFSTQEIHTLNFSSQNTLNHTLASEQGQEGMYIMTTYVVHFSSEEIIFSK